MSFIAHGYQEPMSAQSLGGSWGPVVIHLIIKVVNNMHHQTNVYYVNTVKYLKQLVPLQYHIVALFTFGWLPSKLKTTQFFVIHARISNFCTHI